MRLQPDFKVTPHIVRIRSAHGDNANRIAVLATQVWLHTYVTEGITGDIAQCVLSEFTPEKYLASQNDPATHLVVAEHGESLVGLATVNPVQSGG